LSSVRDIVSASAGTDLKIEDIARVAGCSRATVHNHFPHALPGIFEALAAETVETAVRRYRIDSNKYSGLDKPRRFIGLTADEFHKAGGLAVAMVRASVDQTMNSAWPWGLGYQTTIDCYDEAAEDDDLPGASVDLAEVTHVHFYGSLYLWTVGRLDADGFLQSAKSSVDLAIRALQVSR
jgi:AcrR family transcriptional regulator